jgi:hypothetical protein
MRSRYSRYSKISEDTSALGYVGGTAAGALLSGGIPFISSIITPTATLPPLKNVVENSIFSKIKENPDGSRTITQYPTMGNANRIKEAIGDLYNDKPISGYADDIYLTPNSIKKLTIAGGVTTLGMMLAKNALDKKRESEGKDVTKLSPLEAALGGGLLISGLHQMDKNTLNLAQILQGKKAIKTVEDFETMLSKNLNSKNSVLWPNWFDQMDLPWSYRPGNRLKANLINAGILGTAAGGLGLVAHIINTKKKRNALAAKSDPTVV